jgi:hypothetical protein
MQRRWSEKRHREVLYETFNLSRRNNFRFNLTYIGKELSFSWFLRISNELHAPSLSVWVRQGEEGRILGERTW